MKDIKVGDSVFVVYQRRRHSTADPRTGIKTVVRVGRKYAYIERYHQEVPFSLQNGYSVHKDCNARNNRYGFDVYASEEEYRLKQHDAAEKDRLMKRIVGPWGKLIELPPDAVNELNAILDGHGID